MNTNYFYIQLSENTNATITITRTNGHLSTSDLSYSNDGENFTQCVFNNDVCSIPFSSKVYFRSSTGLSKMINAGLFVWHTINCDKNHIIGGDVRTLIDYTNDNLNTTPAACFYKLFQNDIYLTSAKLANFSGFTTLSEGCYRYMFNGCSSLIQSPILPATNLANRCYDEMFASCSSLTEISTLPATTLAEDCYSYMYAGCSSLTTVLNLPATTLSDGCYSGMFQNCTSLTTAPTLPATTVVGNAYSHMFEGCISLTSSPALPATTVSTTSYEGMFCGCISLTTAPTLPATSLDFMTYYEMFKNCTSLVTAPTLPNITTGMMACQHRFEGCISLINITSYVTNWDTGIFGSWLDGVAATGTFHNLGGATIPTGTSGIPSGWTVVNN